MSYVCPTSALFYSPQTVKIAKNVLCDPTNNKN